MGVCNSGQSERILRNRFFQASQGVNTCLPSDSGVQSVSSGILTVCTTAIQAASVFALQTWKGICWLWGELQAAQADITTLQAQVAVLQAAVPSPIPGVLTVAPFSALGSGGTATLVAGSTTSSGLIQCVFGTSISPGGGPVARLTNSLGWPANFRLIATEGNTNNSPAILDYYIFAAEIYINAYPLFGSFVDADHFDISYSIEKVS